MSQRLRFSLFGTLLLTVLSAARAHTAAGAMSAPAVLTVTGVAIDNSSAKIDFNPVPGAKDYRVFDVSNPMTVKYAGMVHLDAGIPYHFVMQPDGVTPVFPYASTLDRGGVTQPRTLDEPSTEIQWNMLDDGMPHTLVVQAVDQLGPVPPHNLTDNANNPLYPPADMSGANEGQTPDGNMSINGQGPYTNAPRVIAQSQPFVVQANAALRALPSKPDAVQTFFDTFDDSESGALQQSGPIDARTGVMTYTLNAGTAKAWTLQYQNADTDHSMPMIMGGHFMDVLFDGITPSSLPPSYAYTYHTQYSSMAMSPQPTADLSGGKLLHLTEEVDGHMDPHRWLAWQLAPATDPITNMLADNYMTSGFSPTANSQPVNYTDKALWVQIFPQECDATLFQGPRSGSTGAPIVNSFIPIASPGSGTPPCFRMQHWGGNGVGLDNRQRWDIFLTTRHLALFEDGQLIVQSDLPAGGLPFSQAKLYFTHYVYATAAAFEHAYLLKNAPWETYWLNQFQHSDERHWDNMGFEVLPASEVPSNNDFSSLATLIHMPAIVPPTIASATPTPPANATATPTMPGMTPTTMPGMTPTSTPVAGGPLSGTHSAAVSMAGGSDSYTFTPAASGPGTIGSCAVSTGDSTGLYVYNSTGTLLTSSTAPSNCQWVTPPLSSGQSYTVKTVFEAGTGTYRSAWNINGAPVVWSVSGSIGASGGSSSFSFPTLGAGAITASTCGPRGDIFDLSLTDASGATLASSTTPSNCQSVAYTASGRALYRLKEVAVSGTGAWSGAITASGS